MKSSSQDEIRRNEASIYKFMAFSAVVLATISILVPSLGLPMLFSYMHAMQTDMKDDINFCKSKSSNIWKEISKTYVSIFNRNDGISRFIVRPISFSI